jgi:hypothetical protein
LRWHLPDPQETEMTDKAVEQYDYINHRLREIERDKEITRAYPLKDDEPEPGEYYSLSEFWVSGKV